MITLTERELGEYADRGCQSRCDRAVSMGAREVKKLTRQLKAAGKARDAASTGAAGLALDDFLAAGAASAPLTTKLLKPCTKKTCG